MYFWLTEVQEAAASRAERSTGFDCEFCSYRTAAESAFKQHMSMMHASNTSPSKHVALKSSPTPPEIAEPSLADASVAATAAAASRPAKKRVRSINLKIQIIPCSYFAKYWL